MDFNIMNRIKRRIKGWLAVMLALFLIVPGAAEDGAVEPVNTDPSACTHAQWHWETIVEATCQKGGVRNKVCDNPACSVGVFERELTQPVDHEFTNWAVTKKPTCAETGTRIGICKWCLMTKEETLPKTGDHVYDEGTVIAEAGCVTDGKIEYTCTLCGKTKTEVIPQTGHQYGEYEVIEAPTCVSYGRKMRVCSACGDTQYEQLDLVEHTLGEWIVTKAPDCYHTGTMATECTVCGKKFRETLPKLEHDLGEWEIVVPETDHSKGKKEAVCSLCNRKLTEEFDPEGTIRKGGNNPVDEVTELQKALTALDLYHGDINGKYNSKTVEAVKKFQKKLDLPTKDGVCWPQTKKMLGIGVAPGEPVSPNAPDTNKLQLTVVQVSPVKDRYAEGEQITYQWTLKNTSAKANSQSIRIYLFAGIKPSKKSDTEIAQPEPLRHGDSVSGEYVYTVTGEDASSGKIRTGFVARCQYNKSDAHSNTVYFFNDIGSIANDK